MVKKAEVLLLVKKILPLSLVFQILLAGAVFSADRLTLDECIQTALNNHPDLAAAASRINSGQASVGQAASGTRPQVSVGSSYTRSDNSVQNNDSGSYNTNIQASQTLLDWGKNDLSIKGAKVELDAVTADYLATRDTVISNVRTAYYGLNLAIREHEIALTRYQNYERRLEWARSYYQVGKKAKIEVTKAEADFANSRLTLVKSDSSSEQYRSQLASAMGVPMLEIAEIRDVLEPEDWNILLEESVKTALDNRPELLAQRKRVDYAKINLELQMKGKSPSISASAGYNLYGTAPFDENGWSAGVSLSVPIFDGGLTRSKIEGARADMTTAEAQYASQSNSVILEVRRAWESLREAKQSLDASSQSERFAKETLDLALGRYKAGVGDSLEISDAVESYSTAQVSTATSLYNFQNAKLQLQKAMGGL